MINEEIEFNLIEKRIRELNNIECLDEDQLFEYTELLRQRWELMKSILWG
jgi:hypothetical protein